MRELVPFQISAQMIAVLPFKKFTVNTEQGSQRLTTDGKRINITLLKKTQILASYGCLGQPVSSYGLHSGPHLLKPICDDVCLEIPSSVDWKVLYNYRIIKAHTFNFTIRVLLGNFILLFKINCYFSTAFIYI